MPLRALSDIEVNSSTYICDEDVYERRWNEDVYQLCHPRIFKRNHDPIRKVLN